MYASFTPVTIDTAVWTDSIDKMARFISKAEATSLWTFVSIRPIFTFWKIEKVTDHIAEYPYKFYVAQSIVHRKKNMRLDFLFVCMGFDVQLENVYWYRNVTITD